MSLRYRCVLILLIVLSASAFASATEQAKKDDSCSDALDLSKGINPPVLLKRVEPEFSKAADAQQRTGTPIIADAVVTKEGSVTCIKIVRSSDPDLDKIFTDALSQWKYKPASKKGKPVPIRLTITASIDVK